MDTLQTSLIFLPATAFLKSSNESQCFLGKGSEVSADSGDIGKIGSLVEGPEHQIVEASHDLSSVAAGQPGAIFLQSHV
jgi:hypothetical protein